MRNCNPNGPIQNIGSGISFCLLETDHIFPCSKKNGNTQSVPGEVGDDSTGVAVAE